MKLYAHYESMVTYSEYSSEPYGSWGEESDFITLGVSLTNDRKRSGVCQEVFEVPFELEAGQPVYVLTMIYTAGDSFGSSSGNGEIIWVFRDKDIADKAKEALEMAGNLYSIKFIAEGGHEITMSNPASGYFENATDIIVECFMLDP